MKELKIIILAGFSASGKDTIARKIEKAGVHFVVSHTTRPMRDYEEEGNPYHFITEDEFLHMALVNKFVEHRRYETLLNNVPATWHYGVHVDEVVDDKANVVVLDMLGVREFKKHYGSRCVVFFIEATEEERRQRCKARGDYDEHEFERRLEDDKKQFPMEEIRGDVDYFVASTTPLENAIDIMKMTAVRMTVEEMEREREGV